LKLLFGEKMARPLVKMDLKRVEEKDSPQVGSSIFPLQMTNRK
jgi:hypothetical protein